MKARRPALAAALILSVSAALPAQDIAGRWPSDVCHDPAIPATTGECGLMLAGRELLRGRPPATVTIGDPMSPVHLTRYVRGETARAYARRYEVQTRTGGIITFVGLAATLAQSLIVVKGTDSFRNPDGTANRGKLIPLFSSVVVAGSGFPITWIGARNGRRAVDAHNATLSREPR